MPVRGRTAVAAVVALAGLAVPAGAAVDGVAAPAPRVRPAAFAQEGPVVRLAGEERIGTAIAIAGERWEDQEAAAAVVARADLFPDALAGAPLAAEVLGSLLLTRSDQLVPEVAAELQRAVAPGGEVYLLGGTSALAEAVAQQVTDLGFTPVRLAGRTRFETAVAIAQVAGRDGVEFITIADGGTFPDALVAGALAARAVGGVTVLSSGTTLTEETVAFLGQYDVGIYVSVGPGAATAVEGEYTVPGATPEERSVAAAGVFYDALQTVAVASSLQFPDGLAGGAHAGQYLAPLLLAPRTALSDAAVQYVAESGATRGYLYGGTAALEPNVEQQLATALAP